jgi:ABC-type lipoprotein export system ATPase subunit
MQLKLQQLLPTYFDKDSTLQSDIWGKDLVFEKGDLVKIIAPSGSGKTSLISFLYGIRNDYSGTICYDQHKIPQSSPEELSRYRKNHLSIVFQDLRLFPDQTVRQNLEIKRQLNPYHPAEKITEMAGRLGIGSKLGSISSTCSYGEQQRIAIIRSLLQPFDILLLDEPFSHLDNANAEKAMELILEESRLRNATIIFADLERIDYFPYTRLFHL